MENTENTLSLFNGMGCVWLALEEVGIKVNKRYSSETEKFPNQANDALYPDTIQLGDVRKVDVSKLDFINFLAGGSPCQSFSFAGKRKGMSAIEKHEFIFPTQEEYNKYLQPNQWLLYEDFVKLRKNEFEYFQNKNKVETIEILSLEHYLELKGQNFEFEGQSYLFWEYIRILTDIRKYNPDVKFLLENVIMGAKWQKVITQAIGINPIRINAALVSAQNRDRLFWTNIYTEQQGLFGDLKCMIPQPKDQGILLKDVLETDVADKYFLSDKMLNHLQTRNNVKIKSGNEISGTLTVNGEGKQGNNSTFINVDTNRKARCFTAGGNSGGLHSQMDLIVHNTMPRSSKTGKGGTGPLSWTDGKTYCLDTGNTNAVEMVGSIKFGSPAEAKALRKENIANGKDHTPFQAKEITGVDYEKMGTLTTSSSKDNLLIVAQRGSGENNEQQLEPRTDGKTNCLTSVQKDNLVMESNLIHQIKLGKSKDFHREKHHEKSYCIDTNGQDGIKINNSIRRLTPRECGRLQSVPEDKLEILLNCGISDSQLYKMFGNGWNIKVISHILQYLKTSNNN